MEHRYHSSHISIMDYDLLVTCPNCAKYFTDPRVLHCGHTLCLKCLLDIRQSTVEPGFASGILCPTCKATCLYPNDDCLERLPVNHLTLSIIRNREQNQALPECMECFRSVGHHSAMFYCDECEKVVCPECGLTKHRVHTNIINYHTFQQKARLMLKGMVHEMQPVFEDDRTNFQRVAELLDECMDFMKKENETIVKECNCLKNAIESDQFITTTDVKNLKAAAQSIKISCERRKQELEIGYCQFDSAKEFELRLLKYDNPIQIKTNQSKILKSSKPMSAISLLPEVKSLAETNVTSISEASTQKSNTSPPPPPKIVSKKSIHLFAPVEETPVLAKQKHTHCRICRTFSRVRGAFGITNRNYTISSRSRIR